MSDEIEIIVPTDQQEGTESILATWMAKVGDFVKEHDPLVELSTDKAVVEIPSPTSGVLTEIIVRPDTPVTPGMVLGRISPSEQEVQESPQTATSDIPDQTELRQASSSAEDGLRVSPAVRRYAAKYSVDLSTLNGSGHGGRITKKDLFAYLESKGQQRSEKPAFVTDQIDTSNIKSRRVPHTVIRRKIAQHMSESLLHKAPHVTSVFECDMSAVIAHRKANKETLEKEGKKLTFTAYFVQAAAAAIKEVPEVNSRWRDDALEVFEEINIGVGTALDEKGLVVPVIHGADNLDLFQTAATLSDQTEKARSGKIAPSDLANGTFTISNHGVSGSLFATPIIINQPQSAILGIGKLEPRVKVTDNGEFIAKPSMYVSLTIDHRVLDAFHTNAFLTTFVKTLEAWPEN